MMLKRVIGFMFLVASAHSAAALTSIAATDPLNADVAEDTGVGSPAAPAIWAQPTAQAQVQVVTAPAAPAPVPERALSARPLLSLVGTIAGGDEGFAIFLEQSNKAALRLKVGEDYQGWRLRSVQGREATLEKDQQAVTLALPQPGAGTEVVSEVRNEIPPPPATTGKLLSVTSERRPDRAGR